MTTINESQKKELLLISISVLLLVLIGFIVFKFSPGVSRFLNPSPQVIGKSTLTINFGNDKKRAFSGDVVLNENLLDVLTQASMAGNFSYKLNEKSEVVSVEGIPLEDKNSLKNNNKYWQWYLNNEKIVESPGKINPRNGDSILLKYE